MTESDDRAVEFALRDALAQEASTVIPAGDGLSRIQSRTARQRPGWLKPLGAVAATAVLGAAFGVGAYAVVNHGNKAPRGSIVTSKQPSRHQRTHPKATITSPSSPVSTAPAVFPADAIYPSNAGGFADLGSYRGSAVGMADDWVHYVVGDTFASVLHTTVRNGVAAVSFAPGGAAATTVATVVHLSEYDGDWVVTGATDGTGQLAAAAPAPGTPIASPVMVSGRAFGEDENVNVTLLDASGHTVGVGSTAQFSSGAGDWAAYLPFRTPATGTTGTLLITEGAASDQGLSRIVAEQVSFGSRPTALGSGPAGADSTVNYFGATPGSGIGYFTGNHVTRYLPGTAALVNPGDLQLVGNQMLYAVTGLDGGACQAHQLVAIDPTTGASEIIATPVAGHDISGYAVSPDGLSLAVNETSCTGVNTEIITTSETTGHLITDVMKTPGNPPGFNLDPAWTPDGQHLVVLLHTGMEQSLVTFDPFTQSSFSELSPSCSSFDTAADEPVAVQIDAGGTEWIPSQAGSSQIFSCDSAGSVATAFALPGQHRADAISLSGGPTPSALVMDTDYDVWIWHNGTAAPERLHPAVPVRSVAW